VTNASFAFNVNFADVLKDAGYAITDLTPHGTSGMRLTITTPGGRKGSILISQSDQPDDPTEYLHASIAFVDSDPTYQDMVTLHRAVYGRRRWAYQVFAPTTEHVNLHAHALHLWGRADGRSMMPNFGRFGTI